MKMIGKRVPCLLNYELGVDDNGVIQYMNGDFYHDHGTMGENEPAFINTLGCLHSGYNYDTWNITGSIVQTDMPGNCYCRAPGNVSVIACLKNVVLNMNSYLGSVEGIGMIEHVMDHISHVVKKDPVDVRIGNIPPDGIMLGFIKEVTEWSDYEKRKAAVIEFNKVCITRTEIFNIIESIIIFFFQKNRWMKKGICLLPMQYPFEVYGTFGVFISIYAGDGTVAISHGGIEVGQGINTKVS